MVPLLSATSLPVPLKPQRSFPPLKTKPTNRLFNPSSKLVRSSNTTLSRTASTSSSDCEQTHISHDWPQLLQFSIGSGDFKLGQAIHGFLVKSGSQIDVFEGNNLVNLYVKFSRLDDAHLVFDEMLVRNTITWTTLIKGYLKSDDAESVFRIAHDMYWLGEKFNEHTCSVVLQACYSGKDRVIGEQVHGFAVKSGFDENVFVATSLISMYSRSGCLGDADKVFNELGCKDVQCVNNMILELGNAGYGEKALQVFIDMLSSGISPSDYTFTNVISSCYGDLGVVEGMQLHGLAVKYDLQGKTSVGNAVITMYAKNGMVEEAEKMFHSMGQRNVVSWTALISCYVKNGCSEKALGEVYRILDLGIHCDSSCLSTVIDGCSEYNNLNLGLQLHAFVIKLDYLSDVSVGTALVDLYAKCGNLQCARLVFDNLSCKNIASFNAILAGFMESNEEGEEDPMVLFTQVRLSGIHPNAITFSRLLSLSANEACLVRGKSLHAYAVKTGFEADSAVGNALITMYAKCGNIEDAYQMFNGMSCHDFVSWNSIISAFSLHGKGRKTLALFDEMKKGGFCPDEITILSLLQACCYSGLWETGLCLFYEMQQKYRIKPIIEHFACMVDLLGRAGNFSAALNLINTSQFSDSPLLWRSLVNVCKLWGDLDVGILASKKLLGLAPREAGSYILVSNMYARGGMLEEAAKVRTIMKDLKVNKEAGCSWIEIDSRVHHFVASGKDHPESREIYAKLDLLRNEMKQKYDAIADFQLI